MELMDSRRSYRTWCWILAARYHYQARREMSYPHSLNGSYSQVTCTESRSGVFCKTKSVCTNNLTTFAAKWTVSSATMPFYITSRTALTIVLNDEPKCRNGVTLCFQTNLYSVHKIMKIVSVFDYVSGERLHSGEHMLPACIRYHHTGPSPAVRLWSASEYTSW